MIVVLASGEGSNFEALALRFPGSISGLVSNKPHAGCLLRAARLGISSKLVEQKAELSRAEHEVQVVTAIAALSSAKGYPPLRLIVLAGYMRVLSPCFFTEVASKLPAGVRILNLHPAHLDEFKGLGGYAHAVKHLYPRWGITVHEVTPELDAGPIVAACEVPVLPWESASELHTRMQPYEHSLLTQVIAHETYLKGFTHDPDANPTI